MSRDETRSTDAYLVNPDGHRLHYVESGTGSPTIALIHGWSGNLEFMRPQIEHFSRSFRVIAVDLIGHGKSDAPPVAYTRQRFAEELAWMLGELEAAPSVLIGHSLGAGIAIEAAVNHPGVTAAVISLDGALVMAETMGPDDASTLAAALEELADPSSKLAPLADGMFIESSDPGLRSWAIAEMAATPVHVAASALRETQNWHPEQSLRLFKGPLLQIRSTRELRADVAALAPQIVQGMVVGSGHYCQLEVPRQVNSMVDKFLAINDLA